MPRIEKGEEGKLQPGVVRGDSGLFHGRDEVFKPDALDLDILRLLPDEGAMKGRYFQDAVDVKTIKKTLDPTIKSTFYSFRLRRLWDEGLVVNLGTGASKAAKGWQRTAAGKQLATKGTLAEESQ